jgi:drug/metabolite transporter (DMT)-like permease
MNNKHPKGLPYLFFTEMWERFGYYLILEEEVVIWQWFGILLIILAIVIMNINFSKKKV